MTGEKWLDIGQGWLVRFEATDSWMDFHAYEVVGRVADGGPRLFECMGATDIEDLVEDPSEAESISGHVMHDGGYRFDMGERHFDSISDVVLFGDVLLAICGIAADVFGEAAA